MQNGDNRLTVPNELTTLKSSMQKVDVEQSERKKRRAQWIQVSGARLFALCIIIVTN